MVFTRSRSSSQSGTRRGKTLTALASVVVMGLVAAGCSSGPATSDPGKITIFASQAGTMDLNTNSFTLEVEKKFGVDIEFQTTSYESSAATEARQVSLASGDLPDAYMLVPWASQFSRAELQRYGDQGVIVPLNDLIDGSAPNIKAALEAEPGFDELTRAPDGKIWGLPQWNDCYHCSYPSKFWINQTWLDNLGLEMPTTADEFFDVMMAFKTQDPNGNGKADEIPLTGSTQPSLVPFIMNAFIYNSFSTGTGQPVSLGLDGGTVQMQTTQDGWREGLKFLNKMWEAGLIDPAAFSQGPDTMQSTGNSAEGVLVGGMSGMHLGMLMTLGQEDERDKQYEPMPPLNGAAGEAATYTLPSSPGATFVITSAADEEKQKKIIEIMDYLFSDEGHIRGEFGEEGIGWEKPKEGDIALDPELTPSLFDIPTDEGNPADANGSWGPMAQVFETTEFRNSQVNAKDIYSVDGGERRLFEATALYEGKETDAMFPFWNLWIPEEDSRELATLTTNIESNVATSTAEFISGVRDPNDDAQWQAYVDGLSGLGVERYQEIWQTAYDA